MLRGRRVAEYPWTALDRLDPQVEHTLRAARRSLELGVRPERYAAALGALLGAEVELHLLSVDAREPEYPLVRLGVAAQGTPGRFVIGLEAALAGALLAKLLRRPIPLVRNDAPFDPTLLGALSALLVEAARRTEPARALVPTEPVIPRGSALLHGTALLDGRPYAAALWLAPTASEAQEPSPPLLERLSEVELALPLVVAQSLGNAAELGRLTLGSAWCPGSGWFVNEKLEGRGILAAGTSEHGLSTELGSAGRIVLREAVTAPLAAPDPMATDSDDSPAPKTLPQAVLDAPLVVRVELGSVSMKAREWAALRPGDVIETGRRIAEPVVLRAGGRVLARGELVNIEGELGVRVTQIVDEESA